MGFLGFFKKASDKHENEDIVRIDLSNRWYRLLMRCLERDDVDGSTTEVYLKAGLKKDKKGYFIRLPYPEVKLIYNVLYVLWEKLSNQSLQDMQDSLAKIKEKAEDEQLQGGDEMFAEFLASSEQARDLRELLEVFQYQMCPEEYHPFGQRE